MKRFFVFILAVMYLSTSMGATIHLHYCMGKLMNWGLIDHGSKSCMTCGMHMTSVFKGDISSKKNCCKDEHKEMRTNGDQKVTSAEFQFFKLFPDAATISFPALTTLQLSSIILENPTAHAPPLRGDKPLFLLNRNFRI